MLGYIRLVRLPNVFTAIADILAGYLIMRSRVTSGQADYKYLAILCGASAGLYMGGMAFNDVADWKEDALTHPQRPIPSGQISMSSAVVVGVVLLVVGIALVFFCANSLALTLALLLAAYIFLYNFLAKGVDLLGPLTLGVC